MIPNLERLYQESESEFTRNRLKGFMNPQFCDACHGQRLKPEILAVTLGDAAAHLAEACCRMLKIRHPPDIPGLSIMDVCALSVDAADEFFARLKLTEFQQQIAARGHQGNPRAAGLSEERRAGLPDAQPGERHAERR